MSVHAPLNILDYDGPQEGSAMELSQKYLNSLGELRDTIKRVTPSLRYMAFGHFPGSLGNYAGKQRGIPTITAELPSTQASRAAYYFGLIEEGTRVFIEHEIQDYRLYAKGSHL